MKIVILTTHTPHHVLFVNKINAEFPIHSIYLQEKPFPYKEMFLKHIARNRGVLGKIKAIILSPYIQFRFLDRRMIKFEIEHCYKEYPSTYPVIANIRKVYDINDQDVVTEIEKLNPDVIIDFGTGIIKPAIIRIPKLGVFNVHRGILPQHRGWDSDLWAIYFGKYDLLGPTIHFITEGLDMGDIVTQDNYFIKKTDKLYEYRYRATVIAIELTLQVLRKLQKGEPLDIRKQSIEDGTMLSFMPVLLRLYTTMKFYLIRRKIGQ
jgi:folate-dependent phosphoribosylglycinamide formyltransferase PurN